MNEIIPTLVPENFDDLTQKAAMLGTFSGVIHIDAADGIFAPNETWMPHGEKLPERERLFYEAHLMAADPLQRGVDFARAGARRVIAHIEAFRDPDAVISAFDLWRRAGAEEVGLAILIDTPLSALGPYLPHCDLVYLMTIGKIGKQGALFDTRALQRVAELRAMRPTLTIAVDGGVTESVIADLARAGASRFCVGSAIARAKDPQSAYERLRTAAGAV